MSTCEGCHQPFTQTESATRHGRVVKFCSRECANKHTDRSKCGNPSREEEAAENERFIQGFRRLVPLAQEVAYYAQRRVPRYMSPIAAF